MAKNPTNPKLKLFEDDPLTKVLKKEHWDKVDPFTFDFDESASSTLPKDKLNPKVKNSNNELNLEYQSILKKNEKANVRL